MHMASVSSIRNLVVVLLLLVAVSCSSQSAELPCANQGDCTGRTNDDRLRTVMNYVDGPDCSPYPFDVMAIYALYQKLLP